ncbi:MAG: methionine--tRNA ligase subunit beta, partial [Candidatus Hydrothermarchaeota archaeon]|nr:methionine--tRNA ligase subunit beta [Candidatus Hydrothermarchaeota archaeon]
PGQRLDEILPIFPKLRDDEIDKLRKVTTRVTKFEDMFRAGIPYDEFEKIDLRVGKVVRTERIDGSKKLLKLTVKVGGDEKQLVAGLGGKYSPKALIGRDIVVVNNLKPAVIKGIKSEGMLLAAMEGKKASIIFPDREVKSGSRIR